MSKSSVAPSRPAGKGLPRSSLRVDAPCIDLAEQFGQRYRVEYEESYFAQYGPRARVDDPWLKIIPCRAGHICPWGGSQLAAVTNKTGPTARKLAALPRGDSVAGRERRGHRPIRCGSLLPGGEADAPAALPAAEPRATGKAD
jgi:hypothetical protein